MLSDEVRATPRPKPPAKVRARKSSQASTKISPRGKASGSPPPPYYSASEPVLGSPLPVTSQLLEASNGGNSGDGPGPESWLLEKSREELSGLLTKAEGIIKSREERFGFTSQLVKSLHEDNQALKTKYESLVQRIPGASPIASPLGSPRSSFAISRPSSDGNSDSIYLRPQSPIISSTMLSARSPSLIRRKGSKRVSVTPAELGQLTDQNAQLTSQLEDLEKEATKADEAAKRKLGKLEREIDKLKGDLDKAVEQLQQKEKELERSSEVKKQRLEREERLLALREKQQQQHSEVIDFSPPPIPIKRFSRIEADDSHGEQVSFPAGSYGSEVDLISQLMNKIRELEEANREITEQQNESVKKMKKAMIGAEGMKKVYDYLSDDEDLEFEIVDDDDFVDAVELPVGGILDSVPEEDLPIRFSSLRRTINEDIHKRLATELFEDDGNPYEEMEHAHSRPRGSIVGLFDSPEGRGRTISLMNLEDEDSDDLDESKIFSRGVSPIGSPLLMPQDPPTHMRSLGSELGSEYGDDTDENSSEHRHTRTTSLFSLSALITDHLPFNRPSHSHSSSKVESGSSPTSKHHTASVRQRSISTRGKERSSDTGTFDKTKAQLRSRLLSQTISARSTRWSDGRLEDVAISTSKQPRVSAPLISEMFQTAVQQVTGSPSVSAIVPPPPPPQVAEINLDESIESTLELIAADETEEIIAEDDAKEREKERKGLAGFVLEVWLWLQFVLIILVFVWAVARRGPRTVLKDTERKRA